jgi:phosphotransferase system enzyme I (PtsI)
VANKIIEGLSVSAGLSIGTAFILENVLFEPTGKRIDDNQVDVELGRLEEAFDKTRADLGSFADSESGLLKEMLEGPLFHGGIVDRVGSGQTSEDAVVQTTQDLMVIFSESPDPVFRSRSDDAEEVGRRLFRYLHGLPTPVLSPDEPIIIVTDEMTAFDVTRLRADCVAGIITERGGATSHFAIVAKQLGIPAVSGVHDVLNVINVDAKCICDAGKGVVIVDPDEAMIEDARKRMAESDDARKSLAHLASAKTVTADGVPVHLWANITGPGDVQPLIDAGAAGVGMFRTEFIFEGDEAPSEERQSYIYGDILKRTPGPVIMRTIEAGGDKIIPYLDGEPEENPNLGWQGLRMCLDMEDLFLSQLRGMLRASTEGELWIMFPFVSALWELRKCRELVTTAHKQLEEQGVSLGEYKVGIMIEVPSAALMADEYLKDFDFCSIGTNDLTQFTLAADRMNPKVARWYDPFHPAVLRLIAMSAAAAGRAGKPIGMAGDMASNPLSIPFLLGVGLEILSVTAPKVPDVKQTILSVDSRWAKELARDALKLSSTEDVREFFQKKRDEII